MNENIDLREILKNYKPGTKLYSPLFGEVKFTEINSNSSFPIECEIYNREQYSSKIYFTSKGQIVTGYENTECVLFPSKEQRDWSLITPKFDYTTLKPFDKVLVKDYPSDSWSCSFFSHFDDSDIRFDVGFGPFHDSDIISDVSFGPFHCINDTRYWQCIPYNEETKHLLGTCQLPPEFYNIDIKKNYDKER